MNLESSALTGRQTNAFVSAKRTLTEQLCHLLRGGKMRNSVKSVAHSMANKADGNSLPTEGGQ